MLLNEYWFKYSAGYSFFEICEPDLIKKQWEPILYLHRIQQSAMKSRATKPNDRHEQIE